MPWTEPSLGKVTRAAVGRRLSRLVGPCRGHRKGARHRGALCGALRAGHRFRGGHGAKTTGEVTARAGGRAHATPAAEAASVDAVQDSGHGGPSVRAVLHRRRTAPGGRSAERSGLRGRQRRRAAGSPQAYTRSRIHLPSAGAEGGGGIGSLPG
eukprot:15377068-Alexandrium_andersonii.AAC.1